MSKKLAAKNALIAMPVSIKPAVTEESPPVPSPRTRTAVGGMAQFVATQSPVHREADVLREKVKSFEGALLVRAIDPALVAPSAWANRHEDSFELTDFAELKREIKESGGNVQPIKVRPLNGSTAGEEGAHYEIVYGHRRHRACLELHMPVNALIEDIGDRQLFEEMERENRGRKNLSAWEQGCMYQAALDKGLFSSQRKLSESIGVDVSLISKSIALAKLPAGVINAFSSPLDVQYRWAQPLTEALEKDREGVLSRAHALSTDGAAARSAGAILAHLLGMGTDGASAASAAPTPTAMGRAGRATAKLDRNGMLTITVQVGEWSAERQAELLSLVQRHLERN